MCVISPSGSWREFSSSLPSCFSSSCADCSFADENLFPSVQLSLEAQQNLSGGVCVWVRLQGLEIQFFCGSRTHVGHPSVKYRQLQETLKWVVHSSWRKNGRILLPLNSKFLSSRPANKDIRSVWTLADRHSQQHPIHATSSFKDTMEKGLRWITGDHCWTLPTLSNDFCKLPVESELELKI